MNPVLAGLGAACCFASATVTVSRLSRTIGIRWTVAATLPIGFVLIGFGVILTGPPQHVRTAIWLWLACAGATSVIGFALATAALRHGRLSLVVPLISTQGAIAALIAVATGERLQALVASALVVIAVGVSLSTYGRDAHTDRGRDATRSILLATASAAVLGLNLFATGRVSSDLPVVWVIFPSRLAGMLLFVIPAIVRRGSKPKPGSPRRLQRSDVAWIAFAEGSDLIALWLYTLGARRSIAITAVLAAQASPLAVIFAWLFFKERLTRIQLGGFALITTGLVIVTLGRP